MFVPVSVVCTKGLLDIFEAHSSLTITPYEYLGDKVIPEEEIQKYFEIQPSSRMHIRGPPFALASVAPTRMLRCRSPDRIVYEEHFHPAFILIFVRVEHNSGAIKF